MDPSRSAAGRAPGRLSVERILRAVRDACASDPRISFAYLYGSYARGRARPDSDIDVAVWVRRGDPVGVWRDLWSALSRALGRDRVDIVVLDRAPLVLRYLVQREGICAWDGDPERRKRFEIDTRREYWEFEPRLRLYGRALLERLERGTFGT